MKKVWTVEVERRAGLPDDYYRAEHATRKAAVEEARRLIPGAILDNITYIRVWAPNDQYHYKPILDWVAP